MSFSSLSWASLSSMNRTKLLQGERRQQEVVGAGRRAGSDGGGGGTRDGRSPSPAPSSRALPDSARQPTCAWPGCAAWRAPRAATAPGWSASCCGCARPTAGQTCSAGHAQRQRPRVPWPPGLTAPDGCTGSPWMAWLDGPEVVGGSGGGGGWSGGWRGGGWRLGSSRSRSGGCCYARWSGEPLGWPANGARRAKLPHKSKRPQGPAVEIGG